MVRLRKMTQEEYAEWRPVSIADYASEHVRAGNWAAEEAPQKAREAFDQYLPNGIDTEGHYVCSIVDGVSGEKVGHLWYCVEPAQDGPRLFIADLGVDKHHRRRGHARAALQELERDATRLGVSSIRLHVFGTNAAARALYAALGYHETDVRMAKTLSA